MTPEQAKQKLINNGITAVDYARENGFNYRTVVCVLNGTNKGRSGEAHRVAVALGIKKTGVAA
ncbi:MAG: DNA-binding protein [Methylomonas sp.]|nr:MAG: DNA-binding protein [Methylomonas sp.]